MVGSETRGPGQEGKRARAGTSHGQQMTRTLEERGIPGFPAILQPRLMTALKLTGKGKGWNHAWWA